jgi:phage terminase large subunit-like protein
VRRKETRAERNIRWIQFYCRVPDGKDVGKAVKLRPWQKRDIKLIYDNPAGTRTAILSFGKKNAKTTMAAFLLLLHLCGPEARPNSQIPSTAQSKDQAGVLFALAAKMVRLSPKIHAVVAIKETVKELHCPALGTRYKALSAEVATAHGQSPVFAVHDELGQVRGPRSELYNAIENAMGAHERPMSIIISTQAPTDGDLLSILIDDALTGADPTKVVSLYTAPMDLDPFSDAAIRAANPAAGDFLNIRELRRQAEDARRMPSQEALYRNYTLNQRVDASAPFISRKVWQACGGDVVASFDGLPVFAGLDLSSVSDLTAFVAMAPVEGTWHVRPTFWLPEDGLREKSRLDRVPYDVWHRDGFMATTPGPSIDYRFVAQFLWDFCHAHDVRKIGFDRWGFQHLKPLLLDAGFGEDQVDGDFAIFEPLAQGPQTMSPAMLSLEAKLLNGTIRHGGHPVLTMCAQNATVKADEKGNRTLDKKKSHGRIDGMVALAMATAVAGTFEAAANVDFMAMIG